MLDCSAESQPQAPSAPAQSGGTQSPDGGGRPTPGAPGVVTVVPKQVG